MSSNSSHSSEDMSTLESMTGLMALVLVSSVPATFGLGGWPFFMSSTLNSPDKFIFSKSCKRMLDSVESEADLRIP